MTPVAAIDCGTNSLRLLIATSAEQGLAEVERRTEIVRLGQGVDATGEFHPDALRRTFAVLDDYAERIAEAEVRPDRLRFVATSAARDVRNRQALLDGVRHRLGVSAEILTGVEEAGLSFRGALSGVRPEREPVLVADIGGGSTELIVGRRGGSVESAASLDIGSVRLTERFLGAGPPSPVALAAATAFVDQQLDIAAEAFRGAETLVGVAGTVTTLAALHLGLTAYDRSRVHGAQLPRSALVALADRLAALPVTQIRRLPGMHPQRADVIAAGALIASRIAVRASAPHLLVSESDILDGLVLEILAR